MKRKYWVFAALCILFALALSGCINMISEIYHHPDGSGRYVMEMIFTEEMLIFDEFEGLSMEDMQDDLVEDFAADQAELEDHPNVSSANIDFFIEPATGSLHIITELEVIDMLQPLPDDAEGVTIMANPDGTYRFSVETPPITEMDIQDMEEAMDENDDLERMMESGELSYKLHVYELIEADPLAVYNPAEKTVTWTFSYGEIFTPGFELDLWAVYRIDAAEEVVPEIETPEEEEALPEVAVPEPDIQEEPIAPVQVVETTEESGFLGLPNWVPMVLAGLCCLTLIVIGVVVVVFVVLKKRK